MKKYKCKYCKKEIKENDYGICKKCYCIFCDGFQAGKKEVMTDLKDFIRGMSISN